MVCSREGAEWQRKSTSRKRLGFGIFGYNDLKGSGKRKEGSGFRVLGFKGLGSIGNGGYVLWVWELGHAKRRRRIPLLQPMRLIVAVFFFGASMVMPPCEKQRKIERPYMLFYHGNTIQRGNRKAQRARGGRLGFGSYDDDYLKERGKG